MKKLFLFFLTIGVSLQAVAGYVEGEKAFNEQNYALAFEEFLVLQTGVSSVNRHKRVGDAPRIVDVKCIAFI